MPSVRAAGLSMVPERHDLPVSWDGEPIRWHGWSDIRTTLILHVPAERMACDKCGTIDESLINWGTRPARPGEMWEGGEARIVKTGGQHEITTKVPAWPVRDLVASRCRHCGHDTVHDRRTDETWDLEPEDYGDTGSTPSDTLF